MPNAKDVFNKLLELIFWQTCCRSDPKPGAMLRFLKPEEREALKELTSKDVSDVREEDVFNDDMTSKWKEFSKQKMKADEEFKK